MVGNDHQNADGPEAAKAGIFYFNKLQKILKIIFYFQRKYFALSLRNYTIRIPVTVAYLI